MLRSLLKGSSELEVISISKLNHFSPSVVCNHETGCGVTWLLSRLAVDRQRIIISQLLVMATRTTANRKMRLFHSPYIKVLLRDSKQELLRTFSASYSDIKTILNPWGTILEVEGAWTSQQRYHQPACEQKQQAEDVQAEQEPGTEQQSNLVEQQDSGTQQAG